MPATLGVACEGRDSATRASIGASLNVTPYGQRAIAAALRCAEPHGQTARQWFKGAEVLALLPLDGPQGRRVSLVWSVAQERSEDLLGCDPEQFNAEVTEASGGALGALELDGDRMAWPLQMGQADRWHGRDAQGQCWVLAGDAAHTLHPLAGQGLNLGLGDVAELARVLRERPYWRTLDDPRLLRQYERARQAEATLARLAVDGLQQAFAGDAPLWRRLRGWGMQRFDRSAALKAWVARQAMGQTGATGKEH
jgi:ubiquinone biosynthesis UbiH/UbiF/VisC/COQ6 family hydroxylase